MDEDFVYQVGNTRIRVKPGLIDTTDGREVMPEPLATALVQCMLDEEREANAMISINVTVEGPGGCFDAEFELIYRTLVNAGYKVTIKHATQPEIDLTKKYDPEESAKNTHVTLTSIQYPWGG